MPDAPLVLTLAVLALVVGLGCQVALSRRPWAVAAAGVQGLILLWYFGNIAQTGVAAQTDFFGTSRYNWALAQIAIFSFSFWVMVPFVCPVFLPARRQPRFDPSRPIGGYDAQMAKALGAAWVALTAVGLWRINGDVLSAFLPFLADERQAMFGRSATGSGLDFLVSVGEYTHLAVGGLLGAVAVLTSRRDVRLVTATLFILALMPYLFQHARHRTLAVILPAVLALVLIRGLSLVTRVGVAVVAVLAVTLWFEFIIQARSGQRGWDEVFVANKESNSADDRTVVGLEMFDELCYIGTLRDSGRYDPGFFGEYIQEAVAFVPRTVWPDKPLIGIEYAIARGQYNPFQPNLVNATLSRGLVGQGVANCGDHLGPVVAAFLSALWVGVLARMWAQRGRPARLGLYLVGIAVTVNMGRGFSLLALFPFAFAYASVRAFEVFNPPHAPGTRS